MDWAGRGLSWPWAVLTTGCAVHGLTMNQLVWPKLGLPCAGLAIVWAEHVLALPWSGVVMGLIGHGLNWRWAGLAIRWAGHGLGRP